MDALGLDRWQFGVTTVYHFLFVPLTIGLVIVVALMQTAWVRTRDRTYLTMTKFWGKLFLINFAMGVVTGIVQEFQFGMNWSTYSRYVGDIFGAPLAIEGLLAFFMESTFLGLWIFGWGRLGEKTHLATVWLVALGTTLSAIFILGANSWMQNPVGYRVNEAAGRAEMTDFLAILTNKVLLITFPHTWLAAWLTAGMFVLGISSWFLINGRQTLLFRRSAAIGLLFALVGGVGVVLTGHAQGQVMTQVQPMKMAAAEALYDTRSGAEFSIFAIGTPDGKKVLLNITVPHALSVLATNTWDGTVAGINDVQRDYVSRYGPGDYAPIIPVTYWTFRVMTGIGFLLALYALVGLLLLRRGTLETTRWFLWVAPAGLFLPFVGNSVAWIFTEMGRQPWIVFGLLKTAAANSPSVGALEVGLTLAGFTLVYLVLAVVEVWLMLRFIKAGPEKIEEEIPADGEFQPVLAY